jgi:hypothetical protein
MPSLSDYPFDPDREEAFRRGYAHGVSALISGLIDLVSEQDRQKIDHWYGMELLPWQARARNGFEVAPEFPRITAVHDRD